MAGGKKGKKGKGRDSEGERSPKSKLGCSKALWTCLDCEEEVREDIDSIQCGKCKQWCHKNCSGLSEKCYKMLQGSGEEIWWVCGECRDLEGEETSTSRSRMEAKMDRMMEMVAALTVRLAQIEAKGVGGVTEQQLDEKVEKKVSEALEEVIEREKRKLNVILVNVPECEGDSAEERQKGDLGRVGEMAKRIAGVDKEDISNPVRMGARNIGKGGKPRMLRVTVRSEETKRKLLMNAYKLSEGEGNRNRMYINQDRTPKEREEFRKLREELERRRKDEPELVIRGGRIVQGKRGGDRQQTDSKSTIESKSKTDSKTDN